MRGEYSCQLTNHRGGNLGIDIEFMRVPALKVQANEPISNFLDFMEGVSISFL